MLALRVFPFSTGSALSLRFLRYRGSRRRFDAGDRRELVATSGRRPRDQGTSLTRRCRPRRHPRQGYDRHRRGVVSLLRDVVLLASGNGYLRHLEKGKNLVFSSSVASTPNRNTSSLRSPLPFLVDYIIT